MPDSSSTYAILTFDTAMGFGLSGERRANTPILSGPLTYGWNLPISYERYNNNFHGYCKNISTIPLTPYCAVTSLNPDKISSLLKLCSSRNKSDLSFRYE